MPAANHLPDFTRGNGLLPAIAQDHVTGTVLMLAWMNEESFRESLQTGRAVYYSRSRGRLWRKGEESGHIQKIVSFHIDCDGDAILLRVEQVGAACHEGYFSCFFREYQHGQWSTSQQRLVEPGSVYGNVSDQTGEGS